MQYLGIRLGVSACSVVRAVRGGAVTGEWVVPADEDDAPSEGA